MRKLLSIILLTASTILSACACDKLPDQKDAHNNNNETLSYKDPTSKTLVVYYSYTGNCRDIVSSITSIFDADFMEIKPAKDGENYSANNYKLGGDLINAINAKPNDAASYPGIKAIDRNAADYENIIIVAPLWWSRMAAFMQTYLFNEGSKMKNKSVGLIVSSHSSSISSVVADAKRLVPEGLFIEESLWINQSNRSQQGELIRNWLTSYNLIERK